MPPHLASRIWSLAEIFARATEVFGGQEAAENWMTRPAMGLDGERALDLLRTLQGLKWCAISWADSSMAYPHEARKLTLAAARTGGHPRPPMSLSKTGSRGVALGAHSAPALGSG